MSYLDDNGGPEVHAVEDADSSGHRQGLLVRVGPVFHENKQDPEPGIWIEYQEEYMKSDLAGPVLLTPQTWRELTRAVQHRLDRRRRPWWRRIF